MMLAYGSYAAKGIITGSFLLVSLFATLTIFPLVLSYGMNPAPGARMGRVSQGLRRGGVHQMVRMASARLAAFVREKDTFSTMDFVPTVLLPVGALATSVFAGWRVSHHPGRRAE
jgi:SNF family Na+-dependent transporter